MAARRALVAAVAIVLGIVLAPTGAHAASVGGTLTGSGGLTLVLGGADPNGSALRSAMDGNFGPLIDSLPVNETERTALLATVSLEESGIAGSLLFGNRDGTVEANEVTMFETLIQTGSGALSSAEGSSSPFSVSSIVSLTLDGAAPTSAKLGAVQFSNAIGPDASTAPVGVDVTLAYAFPSSGTSHTLALGTTLTNAAIGIALVAPTIDVNLTLPAGSSVTGSTGFAAISVSNDPLGWASPSVSGTYAPADSSNISISYGPAFPTGDVLLVGVPLAGAAALVGVLLWRRRRHRTAPVPPA